MKIHAEVDRRIAAVDNKIKRLYAKQEKPVAEVIIEYLQLFATQDARLVRKFDQGKLTEGELKKERQMLLLFHYRQKYNDMTKFLMNRKR